jgi:hypothetical protein
MPDAPSPELPPGAARPAAASDPTGWLLAAIACVAAALRLHLAARSPLWFEEIYNLLVARRSAADVVATAAADIHPPLPFLLRHAWSRALGEGAMSQKVFSILLTLAALVLAWRLVRRLFGPRPALLTALLLAVTPAMVRYGQEVGMFQVQWLVALLLVDAWTRWLEAGRKRDAVRAVLVGVVALYTHDVFLAVGVVLFGWGLLSLRRDPRRLRTWCALHALVAGAWLPQLPVFLAQLAREGTLRYATLPRRETVAEYARWLALNHAALVPVFALAALLPFLHRPKRRAAALLAVLVVLPPLAERVIPLTFPTEFLFAAPFALALVAAGVDAAPWRTARVALLVLLAVAAVPHEWSAPPFREAVALRDALGVLRRHAAPRDLVVHAETHSLLFALWYDPGGRHRLLVEDGATQYFDGGLVIPDSNRIGRAAFAAERATGRPWWAMSVDRARVTRDQFLRAGRAEVATLDSVATGPRWSLPPVTVWQGRAGSAP